KRGARRIGRSLSPMEPGAPGSAYSSCPDIVLALFASMRRNTAGTIDARIQNSRESHENHMRDSCLKLIEVGTRAGARKIAVGKRAGSSPGILWLGGFKSDMKGTKAAPLDAWAEAQRRAMIRFDYSGHGESGGDFADGTIGRWLDE